MNVQRAVTFFTILIVVLIVAAAFMVIGPPSRERAEALDRLRIDDLRHIEQTQHDDYDTAEHPLPGKLADSRHDPVTGKPYEYQRLGATRYALCAKFERPSPVPGDRTLDDGPFWRHKSGRTCYKFDVRRERMQ